MKIKTSELTGLALDWAVAKCADIPHIHLVHKPEKTCVYGEVAGIDFPYQPSTDWSQGGPIIERERIGTWPSDSIEGMWAARPDYRVYPDRLPPSYGCTHLIAAMRCYVASKLGEEVEVPDELFA